MNDEQVKKEIEYILQYNPDDNIKCVFYTLLGSIVLGVTDELATICAEFSREKIGYIDGCNS